MTITNDAYSISTDKNKLDIDLIHAFLTTSYWAEGISKETVIRSVEGSLVFGLYHDDKQIGFARMITDNATFAYLADVFISPEFRGRGLSKWLVKVILSQPGLQGLRRILLATKDAHGLYSQFGFTPLTIPERWMNIHYPDVYKKAR
ncbi:MAG TPA: GNAT family N-acetyltransferase [Chitinophagaceae bacterium]